MWGWLKRDKGPEAPRISLHREFESLETFLEEHAANVLSGLFFDTVGAVSKGTKVNLRFTFVSGEAAIDAEGKVTSVQTEPPGVRVMFTSIDPAIQRLLMGRVDWNE